MSSSSSPPLPLESHDESDTEYYYDDEAPTKGLNTCSSDNKPIYDPTGLSYPFLHKFWFEDLDHVDDSKFYTDYSMFPPNFAVHHIDPVKPNTLQLVKRFLKQVRQSGGYDVDCRPPMMFNSPYMPLGEEERERCRIELPEYYQSRVEFPISFAIKQINAQTGCDYKLVDILRVVPTRTSAVFLTFTAASDDGSVQTFRALVSSPMCYGWEKKLNLWNGRLWVVVHKHKAAAHQQISLLSTTQAN